MANIAPVAAQSPVPLIGAFEGLRGVSALLVVLYHLRLIQSDFILGGYLSVDVFFVLSGYIMMLNYGGRIVDGRAALDFLGKRIARLYPLFLFTTFTVLLAHGVVEPWVSKLVE